MNYVNLRECVNMSLAPNNRQPETQFILSFWWHLYSFYDNRDQISPLWEKFSSFEVQLSLSLLSRQQAYASHVLKTHTSLKVRSLCNVNSRSTGLYLLVPLSCRRESEQPGSGEMRRYSFYVVSPVGKTSRNHFSGSSSLDGEVHRFPKSSRSSVQSRVKWYEGSAICSNWRQDKQFQAMFLSLRAHFLALSLQMRGVLQSVRTTPPCGPFEKSPFNDPGVLRLYIMIHRNLFSLATKDKQLP